MAKGAVSGDRLQQARDNIAARRQSGLEPRWEDLRDAGLLEESGEKDAKEQEERRS